MTEGRDILIKFETSVLCLYPFTSISILDVEVEKIHSYICRC